MLNESFKSDAPTITLSIILLLLFMVKEYPIVQSNQNSNNAILETPSVVTAAQKIIMGKKMNLNAVSAKDLTLVPGIGSKLASKIVEDRDLFGPFETFKSIERVYGIGEKKSEIFSKYLEVKIN